MIACALTLSLVAPSLVTVQRAVAAPSAADMESARNAYKQGKELRDKGDLAGARDKFKVAHALGQTPITGIELGKTHMQLGELVEAREAFLSVGRIPVASDETKKSADARVECEKLAEDLKVRIPTVKITLSGVPKGKKAKVTVDGEEVPVVALTEPRAVNPGKHTIVAKVAGAPDAKASIELIEGETKAITLYVKAPKKDDEPAEEPAAQPEERVDEKTDKTDASEKKADKKDASSSSTTAKVEAPSEGGRSVLVPIGFVVAGVGLLAGGVTGGIALKKGSDLKTACPGGVCAPANKDSLAETKTLANISTLSFALAGVGAVIGIIGLASGKSASSEPKQAYVQPYIGLGSIGLTGAF